MGKLAFVVMLAVGSTACESPSQASPMPENAYTLKVLIANRPELAAGGLVDKRMVNPWGIALRPPGAGGHIWISNAGNLSTSTYIGDAHGVAIHQDGLKNIALDSPLLSYEDGIANVTGQVYNAASDFPNQPVEFAVSGAASDLTGGTPVPIGASSGPAKFVFVTTEGTIHAWRSNTKEAMNRGVIVMDYSDHGRNQIQGLPRLPAFTGVAMSAETTRKNRLYVTDFHNNTIRVIDDRWTDITQSVPFERPSNLPPGFSPYNIQQIAGRLYVTFAEVDLNGEEAGTDVPGPGNGRLAEYDLDGHLLRAFADGGHLNSPWGLAIAPQGFGPLSGTLLVANFGDGTVAAFDLATGGFRDVLRNASGKPLSIDGIWGLAFGNGVSLGDADSLYYTAGPNLEQDGVFGRLRYAGAK